MNFSARLTPAAITWLGSAFETKAGISPLTTIQVPGFSESEKSQLREQGILDDKDAFTPDAYTVFSELSEPVGFGGFRIAGGFGLIDKMVYFGKHFPVAVDNAGDALVITANQDPAGLRDVMNDILGSSRLMTSGLEISMGEKAARVFGALLDLGRRSAMGYYAGISPLKVTFSREEILQFATEQTDPRWITGTLSRMPMEDRSLSTYELDEALNALEGALCVLLQGDEVELTGDASVLASNLLIIEQQIDCRVGAIRDGKLFRSEAIFLQAGLMDILMIDSGSEGFSFSSVSPQQVIEYLTAIMTQRPEL